ncbi:MAG: hypothetical protein AAF686_02775 [Pseudomonadota bacterium]
MTRYVTPYSAPDVGRRAWLGTARRKSSMRRPAGSTMRKAGGETRKDWAARR